MADRVRAATVGVASRLDGCGELRWSDSRHRVAKAERESVAMRSLVDTEVSMVFLKKSRRLRSEALSWGWAARQWNNVRRRGVCRTCTGDSTG